LSVLDSCPNPSTASCLVPAINTAIHFHITFALGPLLPVHKQSLRCREFSDTAPDMGASVSRCKIVRWSKYVAMNNCQAEL
jgi:hypothetical protein